MSTNGNTSTAVRNARAPRLVEADDETRALWRKLDWFATPPWATRAIAEIITNQLDPGVVQRIWEPACGDGIMARVLGEYFESVSESDIHPQPPQQTGVAWGVDFLNPTPKALAAIGEVDWIITNPPFANADEFTRKAWTIARRGVAMLCRLNWLESVQRYPLFGSLHAVYVFSERVPMQLGPWDPECSSATAYAWFVWLTKDQQPHPTLRFIAPGTRARLTRPDDIRKFCAAKAAPLLD